MKNRAEIETRFANELDQWQRKQARNPLEAYYLWFLPTTPQHKGGIVIAKDKPRNTEYELATGQQIHRNATMDQIKNYFRPILGQLPILEME